MNYPMLDEIPSTRENVDVFKGYNHNLRIADGEFYSMKNMTSDHYPILSPRGRRGVYASPEAAAGLIDKDGLCYVDGTDFVMNGYPIDMGLNAEGPKQLISMGAYVIILPDKKYINTADINDFGNIEAEYVSTEPVTFSLCRLDGTEYITEYIQPTEPESPADQALWIDTSSTPHALRQWAESSGMWVSIATCYVKISAPNIGKAFEQYDGITISGLSGGELTDTEGNVIPSDDLAALDGAAVVWARDDHYILVVGMLDMARTISNQVTISRKMPNLDFVVESENRIWGCRYGVALNGEIVNEIYASKLGDFKNWNCFMHLSTDSYVASVGTDGQFTGAITLPGTVLFFKENCIHKVYGNFPSNFKIQTTMCRGVQKGCERSLAIVNEVIYYKAKHAVCAYDGSLPVEVSQALGDVRYKNAVAGAHGNKYYISMEDGAGDSHLFVFDTNKGLWHREDNLRAACFCSCREEMYCIDSNSGKILALLGSGEKEEGKVPWMAETGIIGTDDPDSKYIARLSIRLNMEIGSSLRFWIQYDSRPEWEMLGDVTGTNLRSVTIPVIPRRCDHFRLRLEGKGQVLIYSITKTIEEGGEPL